MGAEGSSIFKLHSVRLGCDAHINIPFLDVQCAIGANGMQTQKPSKLELYIEILRSLEKLQASNILSIHEATNIEQAFLTRAMTFLEAQNLVRKESVENQAYYTVTARGDRVSRYFTREPQTEQPDAGSITSLA